MAVATTSITNYLKKHTFKFSGTSNAVPSHYIQSCARIVLVVAWHTLKVVALSFEHIETFPVEICALLWDEIG